MPTLIVPKLTGSSQSLIGPRNPLLVRLIKRMSKIYSHPQAVAFLRIVSYVSRSKTASVSTTSHDFLVSTSHRLAGTRYNSNTEICAFIHEARVTAANNAERGDEPNGGVLVHCYRGVSRSVTAVMAYLMWAQHYDPVEAFHVISKRRVVAWPNKEFFSQLNIWHMTDCQIVDEDGNENPVYTEYYVDKQLRPAVEFDEDGRNPNAEAIVALAVAAMPRPDPDRRRR